MRVSTLLLVGLLCAAGAAQGQGSVTVNITEPTTNGNTVSLDIFAPGGTVPSNIPLGVRSVVSPLVRGSSFDSVVTEVGGTLNDSTAELTGESAKTTGTLVNTSGADSEYLAVVSLAGMDFQSARVTGGLFADDFVRTLATSANYYARSVTGVVGVGEIGVDVSVRPLTDIDTDSNGIPNASLLGQGDRILFAPNGTVTVIKSLTPAGRGLSTVQASNFYDTANGPVEITVDAPTLATLQAVDSSFNVYDTGVLIMTVGGNTSGLVDSPIGVSPISEFDLTDGSTALPAPQNVFVRAAIAVATLGRGSIAPTWTFINGDLPGGLSYVGTLSGPGVAAALQSGLTVGAYTYGVTFTQTGESIDAVADENGWEEADSIVLNDNDNADRTATAETGDDTVRATFSSGSAIFGSNVTPRATSSSSDDNHNGLCFIATAAYGTPMAAQIKSLRSIRDVYLIGNPLGAAFVDSYYRISPPIAGEVSQNPMVRGAVRLALTPVLALSGWLLASPGSFAVAALALVPLSLAGLRRIRRFRQA